MIPRDEAEAFWAVTRECLVQFHGIDPEEAASGVASLRDRLARTGVPMAEEMIYHDEPFNVACDIAGNQLDEFDESMAEEYYRMLERPFPVLNEPDAVGVHEPQAGYGVVS